MLVFLVVFSIGQKLLFVNILKTAQKHKTNCIKNTKHFLLFLSYRLHSIASDELYI